MSDEHHAATVRALVQMGLRRFEVNGVTVELDPATQRQRAETPIKTEQRKGLIIVDADGETPFVKRERAFSPHFKTGRCEKRRAKEIVSLDSDEVLPIEMPPLRTLAPNMLAFQGSGVDEMPSLRRATPLKRTPSLRTLSSETPLVKTQTFDTLASERLPVGETPPVERERAASSPTKTDHRHGKSAGDAIALDNSDDETVHLGEKVPAVDMPEADTLPYGDSLERDAVWLGGHPPRA